MYLIKDEDKLRTYLPNAFASVEGEVSLYDKLQPWLQTAELWLQQKILGTATLQAISLEESSHLGGTGGGLHTLACKIVVATAFRRAIPSLDLVLTPNGFGIVSNSNVAPASKERIERLQAELDATCNEDTNSLLQMLPMREDWHDSLPYRFWSSTLFPDLEVCNRVTTKTSGKTKTEIYLWLQPRIIAIEDQMAEEFLSSELLEHLRHQLCTAPSDITTEEARVLKQVKAEIINILNGNPPNRTHLTDIVNYIRQHQDAFPLWYSSDTAKLFTPPIFENKKEARGYFF